MEFKFKVGDRVRTKTRNREGTIIMVNKDKYEPWYLFRSNNEMTGGHWAKEISLEKMEGD